MTDHPTPGQPLTAESVGLLKAGDVLRHKKLGLTKVRAAYPPDTVSFLCLEGPNSGGGDGAEQFTFIGRPGPDGFIPWSGGDNPVPGQMVDVETELGSGDNQLSDALDWSRGASTFAWIERFRLTPASPPIEDAERAGDGLDRLKANLAEEIRIAAEESDATPLERHVARALTSNDAKANGLVDRVWVVSLPDARKAIAAIAEWPTDPVSDVEVRLKNALKCVEQVPGRANYALLDKAEDDIRTALALIARSQPKGAAPDAEEEDAYEIGKRDGYESAVQDIDILTGGDGEYRFCPFGDPERHTPDATAMKARIVERFTTEQPKGAGQSSGEWKQCRSCFGRGRIYKNGVRPYDCSGCAGSGRLPDFKARQPATTDNADGLSADRETIIEAILSFPEATDWPTQRAEDMAVSIISALKDRA